MMRLLVDVMRVHWDEAWELTTKCSLVARGRVFEQMELAAKRDHVSSSLHVAW